MSRASEWSWIAVSFLLLNFTLAGSQPVTRLNDGMGLGFDGQTYHATAKSFPRGFPPEGIAPFVHRLGTPLMAATVAKSLDWVISAGFDRLNVVFNGLSVVLLAVLLQQYVPGVFERLLVLFVFMIEPHSPVRFTYFSPVSADPAALCGLLAGLLALAWFDAQPSRKRARVLSVLVAIGVVFHEAMLLIAVCLPFCRMERADPPIQARRPVWDQLVAIDRNGAWQPLVIGLMVIMAIRVWVTATPSSSEVTESSVLRYGVAWFFVFGPLIVLPLYFWRRSSAFLRQHAWLAVYLALFGALGWFGNGQIEPWLVFASPVVYVLIGLALGWAAISPASVAMATIVFAQLISARVFVPIGGPILPPEVGSEIWERLGWAEASSVLSYANMCGRLCTSPMLTFYVLFYGAVAGILIVYLRRRNAAGATA